MNVPGARSARAGDVRHAVDVVGLPRRARLHALAVDAIDERAHRASEPLPRIARR